MRNALGAELLLAQFLNNSAMGLAIVDESLCYRAVNTRLAEMNGVPIEFHLGKTIREVLGDVALQVEPAIKRVFATGHPMLTLVLEGILPARDEPTIFVDHLFPIKDQRGRIKHVGAVAVELELNYKSESSCSNELLRSWKEIASYVGTCVKTAQRWERQYDFPVRRLNKRKGAVVFAFKTEVDSWMDVQTRRLS